MTHSLAVEVEGVRAALIRHADRATRLTPPESDPEASDRAPDTAERTEPAAADSPASGTNKAAEPVPTGFGLAAIVDLFRLSPFETKILVLCAGIELDASFAALCAKAQADPDRSEATFGLALAVFPDNDWQALLPSSPLRYWRLVHLVPGGALTATPLRIDERILHALVGLETRDEWLFDRIEPVTDGEPMVPSHTRVAARIAETWSEAADGGGTLPVVQLCGDADASKRGIAVAVAKGLGLALHRMDAGSIPTDPEAREELLRRWRRESLLAGAMLLLDVGSGNEDPGFEARLRRFVERGSGPLMISRSERMRPFARPSLVIEVEKPTHAEQRQLWSSLLGEAGTMIDLDRLVAQFHLEAAEIPAIALVARGHLRADARPDLGVHTENGSPLVSGASVESEPGGLHAPSDTQVGPRLARALWASCRQQARPRLDDLAQRVVARSTWEDLVLPRAQLQELREIAAHVGQRARVLDVWGFASNSGRGLGVSALFAGTSGTGKTMAAEVLASDLDLDLYRIDLSSVVSKYIGETEKNLRRVFDAAEEGGAILLFDEADALFGKRSEVKDSHDRYANVEISYLLQRVETYRGLAILTSNFKEALDAAFMRRLRFIVEFPFPSPSERREMWRRVFPVQAPTDGLDFDALARLDLTGGNIRSIALAAAFVAAAADRPIRMSDLRLSVHRELSKLGKPLSESETRGWRS